MSFIFKSTSIEWEEEEERAHRNAGVESLDREYFHDDELT